MYATINSIGILLTLPHKLRWRLNMIIVTGQLATTINFHSPQFSGWFLILFMGCKVILAQFIFKKNLVRSRAVFIKNYFACLCSIQSIL